MSQHHKYSCLDNINGNLLCSIGIKTTGDNPLKDTLIQIFILPLNSEVKPYKDLKFFLADIRPPNEELSKIKVRDIRNLVINGLNSDKANFLFQEWFDQLKLEGKKLVPLSYNWPEVSFWLKIWLGFITFNSIFDYRFRDLLPVASFENDKANFEIRNYPYPKIDFQYICNSLRIEGREYHDIITNTLAVATAYRDMIFRK